jgi:hypothetical protein
MRTQTQIQADMQGVDTSDETLTVYYDLTDAEDMKDVKDSSKNGNDLIAKPLWIDEEDKAPVSNNGYTFAVVGDTQWTNYAYNEHFAGIYDWILDNKESKNINQTLSVSHSKKMFPTRDDVDNFLNIDDISEFIESKRKRIPVYMENKTDNIKEIINEIPKIIENKTEEIKNNLKFN